jgi:hypothetical protein
MTEIFKSTHDALTFAFNYSAQQYALSPMSKMIKTGIVGSGRGLVSVDGAAQAGFILAEVDRLGQENPIYKACIVARFSPKFKECPCCHHPEMPLQTYKEAIAVLRDAGELSVAGISLRQMREAIIRGFYERGVSLKQEAQRLNVPKSTAYDQKSVIVQKLKALDAKAQSAIAERLDKMLNCHV